MQQAAPARHGPFGDTLFQLIYKVYNIITIKSIIIIAEKNLKIFIDHNWSNDIFKILYISLICCFRMGMSERLQIIWTPDWQFEDDKASHFRSAW